MNTSEYPQGLPDIAELEKLANQFFKALPGENSANVGPVQPSASAAGRGVSPSAIDQHNAIDLKDPQTSFPDPNMPDLYYQSQVKLLSVDANGLGHIPGAVAGSGISPSAIEQHNAVDLVNPQTSFPDPQTIKPVYGKRDGYTSYLQRINGDVESAGITPLGVTTIFDPLASFVNLSQASGQPVADAFSKSLLDTSSLSALPQVPGLTSSGPVFYFLNEKKRSATFVNHSKSAEDEFRNSDGAPFDVNRIKRDFPILQEKVNGKPLVWLDNAATTQKPQQVIDRISYFYQYENSNIHRAAHELAARATDAYEEARAKVQRFLNAGSPNTIIFVRGATEAINLVAKSWGEQYLNRGDEIIVSHLEHHANIVPWQQLAAKNGLNIKVIPVDDDGQLILSEYAKLLGPKTKLVAFSQVSNALGTITPAKEIVDMAHVAGAKVLVDGAQSVSHMPVDVTALNADWFVFSGHKVFGPTGIGVLYGKEDLLNETQPWQGGGNMIKDVTFQNTSYHDAPLRFEAGTGNIADAVGLGAAIDYVSKIGMELISRYEHYLLQYATGLLKDVPGLHLVGTAREKASVLSFVLDGFSTAQVGTALNKEGIAVRSGHHCAQPILRRFGLENTVRPSLAFYNTCADIDVLVNTLYQLVNDRIKK